ncbi:hypothetical protein HNQ35_002501 [Cerasibacillus quisquiliarum]|uniref:Uncharacterized protein n=1 Tax=Cerasibacillus quisquiliarum TaxID=227865 RepID=A0A511V2M7_9BACI|nr:hypothetical protein [Cerasibacillus quisquiliarum]GEN32148.1 hypothetical protein CQU01_23860 [Cerasibacillus quisquiliarum]
MKSVEEYYRNIGWEMYRMYNKIIDKQNVFIEYNYGDIEVN